MLQLPILINMLWWLLWPFQVGLSIYRGHLAFAIAMHFVCLRNLARVTNFSGYKGRCRQRFTLCLDLYAFLVQSQNQGFLGGRGADNDSVSKTKFRSRPKLDVWFNGGFHSWLITPSWSRGFEKGLWFCPLVRTRGLALIVKSWRTNLYRKIDTTGCFCL